MLGQLFQSSSQIPQIPLLLRIRKVLCPCPPPRQPLQKIKTQILTKNTPQHRVLRLSPLWQKIRPPSNRGLPAERAVGRKINVDAKVKGGDWGGGIFEEAFGGESERLQRVVQELSIPLGGVGEIEAVDVEEWGEREEGNKWHDRVEKCDEPNQQPPVRVSENSRKKVCQFAKWFFSLQIKT